MKNFRLAAMPAYFYAAYWDNVWDNDNADALLQMLKDAIRLIENDYLGGSGSRGYGQVTFGELSIKELSAENNWK